MYTRELIYQIKRGPKTGTVLILGPQEVGKTSFVKTAFKNHKYVSFKDPDARLFAINDPERFLAFYKNEYGVILDDIEHVPTLLPHIKMSPEFGKKTSYFVLVSSQLLPTSVLATLPEKYSTLTLLPYSLKEMKENSIDVQQSADFYLLKGGYPRQWESDQSAMNHYYKTYVQTFIEREIKPKLLEKNIGIFEKFLTLCASNVGMVLNLDRLAEECGISYATARQWVALLEKHFFVFLLQPHGTRYNKRVTKSPKLYFFDTGLACALLRITTPEIVALHPLRTGLFENFIITDIYKQWSNAGYSPAQLSYWRDQNGRYMVDCLVHTDTHLISVDIKSGETLSSDCFKKLQTWNKISQTQHEHNIIIYAGHLIQA